MFFPINTDFSFLLGTGLQRNPSLHHLLSLQTYSGLYIKGQDQKENYVQCT